MERFHVITGDGGNVHAHMKEEVQESMNFLAAGLKIPDLHPEVQNAFIERMAEQRRMAGMLLLPVLLMDEMARNFANGTPAT